MLLFAERGHYNHRSKVKEVESVSLALIASVCIGSGSSKKNREPRVMIVI